MSYAAAIVPGSDADTALLAFLDAVQDKGIALYPAQEEAILEIYAGKHVILNTPTGSGKSLVATALHFKAQSEGKRSYYTCPIKALAHEKFFALSRDFGADQVGLLTGDASINRDAPIICCTAEIVANLSLGADADAAVDYVIMDEFHYYSDRDRGMAWQLPLLTLRNATFLLMSATLGDCDKIEAGLTENTGREVAHVRSHIRPVPLDFQYLETPLHETLAELATGNKAPIYVVNFTQRECVEQAQNVLSQDFLQKEQKQAIQAALAGFRFDTPFGKDMRRFVSHGVGLHHAGLLPKYRLVVEKLAQEGLLKIIMGTDTLGVGVNVPIRSVVFTKLCKYDGEKTGILSVRDFRQIAGRAGRKGFDEAGTIIAQAPEHVIENKRMESRVADNPAKKRKLVKKKPPARNYVPWDATTFQRLQEDKPEAMQSRFTVSFATLLTLLQHHPDGYGRLIGLIRVCHDSAILRTRHRRQARTLFQSLRAAGVLAVVRNRKTGNRVRVHEDLGDDFSLHHTLTLYLIDTLAQLDPEAPTHALDVLTLVESILENPHVILARQMDRAKDARMAEMKAEGMEYEERIAELEKIEHPKPLGDFIYATFNAYAAAHPWVGQQNIYPKSIARDMFERCASFPEYIREYNMQRQEGILLRYLSQVVRALQQSIPDTAQSPELEDITIFLRTLVTRIDSSLVTAWSDLLAPPEATGGLEAAPLRPPADAAVDLTRSPRALKSRLRTELHRLTRALAIADYDEAAACVLQPEDDPWPPERLKNAMAPFFAEYGAPIVTPEARKPEYTLLQQLGPKAWQATQTLLEPTGDNLWALQARVDFDPPPNLDGPLLRLERIG
jgi:superfamily II DNA/RNA helicase